jgi:hypothetical protein
MVERVSADKMMIATKGPVWHKKQKQKGIVPPRLRGLDREATWSFSNTDGWVYGHGSFCLSSHPQQGHPPVLGRFIWMPNSANEAKRLQVEMAPYKGLIEKVCMDSKADDYKLYTHLEQCYAMQLLTAPRSGADKTPERRHMIRQMRGRFNRMIYRQRSTTVEPMQALVKEIFDLHRCWMRGNASNRWLFAAMGVAVQIAQRQAYRQKRSTSTWCIQEQDAVLGL